MPAMISGSEKGFSDFSTLSILLAIFIAVTGLISFRYSRGLDKSYTPSIDAAPSLLTILSQIVKNKVFVIFFIAYFVAYAGVAINSTLALYYYEYKLGLNNKQVAAILLVFIVFWLASAFIWLRLSQKIGKKKSAFSGVFFLGLLTSVSYPFFPPESLVFPMIMSVIGGFLVGSIFLFDSLLADLADEDSQRSGVEKEGAYFGFAKFAMKSSRSIAVGISGILLGVIHFSPNTEQSVSTKFQLGLLFGPVVGFFFILSALVFLFMPWQEKKA
ncbi:MAG: MFS transporter [Spirochaetota bacterium]